MPASTVSCTFPGGCNNSTTDPSGRCHHHRGGSTGSNQALQGLLGAAPTAATEFQHGNGFVSESGYTQRMVAMLNAAYLAKKPAIMWGDPGTGKTELVYALAGRRGLHVEEMIGSQMDPTDVSGAMSVSVAEDNSKYTEFAINSTFRRLMQMEEGVLLLEEFSNTPPSVQASLLTVIQTRRVPSGEKLPDGIWIVALANGEDTAADGQALAPPTANRFLHLNWAPPVSDWQDGMLAGWGKQLDARQAREYGHIVAFIRSHPSLLHDLPDDDVKRGGAWPSRRSWHNLADTLCHIDDAQARLEIATGFVGEQAAGTMAAWADNLKLPDPSDILDNPNDIDWGTADKTYAMLASVVPLAEDRIADVVDTFIIAGEQGQADVAGAVVPNLLTNAGHKLTPEMFIEMVAAYQEVIEAAGINAR